MYCVLNFLIKILLILTYDLGSIDHTMNYSPLHVMWVLGFRSTFVASLGLTPLHDQDVQEQKSTVSLNFHCEFYGRSNAVELVKKLLLSCWPMWPNHESVVDVSEPLSGFVVHRIQCYFLKVYY
jgi:hypothetical protein